MLKVHDLHIWSLSVGKPALSVHILTEIAAQDVLVSAHTVLLKRFKISHTTIQVETLDDDIACNNSMIVKRPCIKGEPQSLHAPAAAV